MKHSYTTRPVPARLHAYFIDEAQSQQGAESAYFFNKFLMPDGSMKLDGKAVAETLRSLSNTKWLARSFDLSLSGLQSLSVVAKSGLCHPGRGASTAGLREPWNCSAMAATIPLDCSEGNLGGHPKPAIDGQFKTGHKEKA
jgi:hypothetical protein